jgi:hypothetical protein
VKEYIVHLQDSFAVQESECDTISALVDHTLIEHQRAIFR